VLDKRRKSGLAAARATMARGPGGRPANARQGSSAAQKGTAVAGAVKGKDLHRGFADSGTVALKGNSGKPDTVTGGEGKRRSALQNRLYRSSNFADGIS